MNVIKLDDVEVNRISLAISYKMFNDGFFSGIQSNFANKETETIAARRDAR